MTNNGVSSRLSRFSRSLSLRQARLAVLTALILGISFSAFQIASDLRSERRKMDIAFKQSLKAFEESAFQAAFGLDTVLAQTVVRGLFRQSAIFEAQIADNFGDRMAIEQRPQRRPYQGALGTRTGNGFLPLPAPFRGRSRRVGKGAG